MLKEKLQAPENPDPRLKMKLLAWLARGEKKPLSSVGI